MRRALSAVCEGFAIVGGLIVLAAIIFTVVAVVAARFGAPILGNTEIVEMSVGVAIAFFLPWCQIQGANVIVDFFTARVPDWAKAVLDAVMSFAFTLVVAVLAWRLIIGGIDAFRRDRVTMFLQLPMWWGFAAAAPAMILWTLVCLLTALESALRLTPRAAGKIASDEMQ